jgi:2-methylisocitrate lyase-like PEP mutase family enzyme
MFARIRQIVDAVALPMSGDLEDGYGERPEAVAETMRLALEAGLVGGNIEDNNPRAEGLYDEALAVERIAAARAAIDASGSLFVLCARTDAFLVSPEAARRTCIRRALVREIAAPINIVIGLGSARMSVPALLDAGVARISPRRQHRARRA